MKSIRAIPTKYRDVLFRSTLEADWAATLDSLGMLWSYEPEALDLGTTFYLPDFYLPIQHVWMEVKGPHRRRIDKPILLADALLRDQGDLVVIGYPPNRGEATWECVTEGADAAVVYCTNCDHWTFVDWNARWACRVCWRFELIDLTAPSIPFMRARKVAA